MPRNDPTEWDFDTPASQVDLERIANEVSAIPAVFAAVYMDQLRTNAPTVYERLHDWASRHDRMTWCKFR